MDSIAAKDDVAPSSGRPKLSPEVLKLGVVSFLTDVSSEAIFSVFAMYLTTIAGASSALLGLVEGLADFSASSLNYMSGWLSDRSGRRKAFAVAGYALSTLAKTILPISAAIASLSAFRVVERLGKGLRGPPRDAWLSSLAPPAVRGYSFGVHKALDKAGAVLGPLMAYGLLRWQGDSLASYRTLFWVALVPALLSVAVLSMMQDRRVEPHEHEGPGAHWQALSPGFKRFVAPSGVFALAYYSLGFLLLKAHAVGFTIAGTVLLYALFNTVCVIAAPLVGRVGDAVGRGRVVLLGYGLYGSINIGFIFASQHWHVVALFAAYGVFFAIDESQGKAFIADLEPERRATAVGAYNLCTGVLYLPASLIAGALWTVDPRWAFGSAALLAAVAILLFAWMRPSSSRLQDERV
jgi:MFS family permease